MSQHNGVPGECLLSVAPGLISGLSTDQLASARARVWLAGLERRQKEQEPARRQRAIDDAQRARDMANKVLL